MTPTAIAIEFKEITLRSGVRLRYAELGPRTGRPVLLLHGYSDSWFSFSPILGSIDPQLRLIVPDQRGHGDSDRPDAGYAPRHLAVDALALLDALGIGSAVAVGHSMGSFVVQHMMAVAPNRVNQAVLVGSAASADNEVVRSLVPLVQALTDPVDPAFVREFQQSTIHRPVPPAFLDRAVRESLKLPAKVWKAVLAGLLDLPALLPAGSALCPVHLFWGDHDTIFGQADQGELLKLYPGSRLEVFKDVGHAVHWEAPHDFAIRLQAALA
jgi:pimeloyl-ACP methyl ester carboxylesterase